MAIEVEVRKVGNSLGIILPSDFVRERHLKVNDKVNILITKQADLSKIFGSLKGKLKMSGQEFKDLAREGWD